MGHIACFWPGAPKPLQLLGSPRVHGLLSALAMLGPGRDVMVGGFTRLLENKPNMDSLVALGAAATTAVSVVALARPALAAQAFFMGTCRRQL